MGTKAKMNFDCFNVSHTGIDTDHQSETFHQKMVSNYLNEAHIRLGSVLCIRLPEPAFSVAHFFYWQF